MAEKVDEIRSDTQVTLVNHNIVGPDGQPARMITSRAAFLGAYSKLGWTEDTIPFIPITPPEVADETDDYVDPPAEES